MNKILLLLISHSNQWNLFYFILFYFKYWKSQTLYLNFDLLNNFNFYSTISSFNNKPAEKEIIVINPNETIDNVNHSDMFVCEAQRK